MFVAEILKTKGNAVFSIAPDLTVTQACAELEQKRVGALVVCDGDRVVGVFSERDVVKAFADANPEVLMQGKYFAGQPVPASFAKVNYWGVHAFGFVDSAGKKQFGKWVFEPVGGTQSLTDEEAKAKGSDFLIEDIRQRVKAGELPFHTITKGKLEAPDKNQKEIKNLIQEELIKRYQYQEGLYQFYLKNNFEIKPLLFSTDSIHWI